MLFNLVLFFYLCAIAPKIFLDRLKGKRHPSFFQRCGAFIPNPNHREVIWIHSCSVGEAKAASPLLSALKKEYPEAFFLVTTTTATGLAEAKRSLFEADAFRYIPFDFTWIVRRWANKLRPKFFLLIESDIWPNLLAAIQKSGGKTILVSGKLSEKSAKRFRAISFFSRKLFNRLHLLLVQNEIYRDRFLLFADPNRIHIVGNLKFDIRPKSVNTSFWRHKIPLLTLSCTHAPEEEQILDVLIDLDIFIFLAPRHPERFKEVASLLEQKKISFIQWSRLHDFNEEKIILVDEMGHLPVCYSLSQLAIIGGSFTSRIGGHNILEPCLYNAPVLFGPYMFSQEELANHVLKAKAGMQVSMDQLRSIVLGMIQNPEHPMRQSAKKLMSNTRRVTEKILSHLRNFSQAAP